MGTGLTDLAYLSATEALAAFRARTLSPVELMGAVIARAEAVEPSLNALPYRFFDQAMAAGRQAETRYGDGTARPLEGLPIAIKASSDIEGQPDTRGSLALKEGIATRTATVNARMMAAGGIVHARSATPEFSCTTFCHSRLWGVTRNPWDLAMTPGGSSGGAGAALAAGMATLATGSDIGGSIRVPASCCGVVGVKPPYGRVPGDPPFNLDPFCHNGPMARTVGDAALMQNLIAGPDGRDIAVLPAAPLPESFAPVRGMRVALSLDLGLFALEEDVRANTLAAAEVFRGLGAEVEEISLGWGPDILEGAARHLIHIFGASMAPMLARADDLTTYARAFAEAGTQSRPSDLLFAMDAAARAYGSFAAAMEGFDVLLCPTTARASVPADLDPLADRVEVAGQEVHPVLGWVMTTPFNMLSRCPVISMPSGLSGGVPTGVQIVGHPFRDLDVFRAAAGFEAASGLGFRAAGWRPAL